MDIIEQKVLTPRVLSGSVVIEVERHYETKIKHNSLELEVPEGWASDGEDKARLATTSGMVISIPDSGSATGGIRQDVKVGDKVYFHYNAINRGNTEIHLDERKLHRIAYQHIFCAIRDGKKIMICGRVLCKPFQEGNIEEFRGTSNEVSSSGIIIKRDIGHSTKKAVVAHIGENLVGREKENINTGDIVLYEPNADFENEIEGETYFVMTQEDIVCKLNQ
jgi:co-chaperonin GroES (HSP10)